MIKQERIEEIKKMLKNYPIFELLGKGKRGIAYKISSNLVVKIERDDINTFNTLKNEYNILSKIGKYSYFPKPIDYNNKLRFLIREFVPGERISEVELNQELIRECLRMCYVLDKEGVNQSELTNPFKHIYVYKKKVMMIDFERARLTNSPKNVSQFIQYLIKRLKLESRDLIKKIKEYKKQYNKKKFESLLSLLLKLYLIH